MFRTKTGQTGKDAYRFEAAQISNQLRELQTRLAALKNTMQHEVKPGTITKATVGRRLRDVDLLAFTECMTLDSIGRLQEAVRYMPSDAVKKER